MQCSPCILLLLCGWLSKLTAAATALAAVRANHPPPPHTHTCRAHDVTVDVTACAQCAAHVLHHTAEHSLQVLLQHTVQLVCLAGGQAQRAVAELQHHTRGTHTADGEVCGAAHWSADRWLLLQMLLLLNDTCSGKHVTQPLVSTWSTIGVETIAAAIDHRRHTYITIPLLPSGCKATFNPQNSI